MTIGGRVGSHKTSKATLVAAVFVMAALPLDAARSADATTTLAVDIDPQPLEAALVELSKQGRLQLVISTGSLPVRTSVPLHGSMSIGAALEALLKDTGLTYKFVGDYTIAIVKSAGRTSPPSGSPTAPETSGVLNADKPTGDAAIASGVSSAEASKADGLAKRNGFFSRLAAVLGICVSVSGPGTACAQKTGTASAADSFQLEEIVVTAMRREESALRVPAALSVLSGADLKTQGVNNVADLQNVAPGLTITRNQFGMNINMRGVQTTDFTSKGEQDVSFNVDGVYVGRPQAQAAAFFDIARVEVLRGPQGTLYGRSSTAGAINVITNAPKLGEQSGYANIEYANYNARRVEAAVNIPLSDTLAIRASGAFNKRDGYSRYMDQSVTVGASTYRFSAAGLPARNDQDDTAGRFSILYSPNEDVTARLTANIGRQGGVSHLEANYDQLEQENYSGSDGLKLLANPIPSWLDEHLFNLDGSLNWRFGAVQMDVLGSQQQYKMNDQMVSGNNPVSTTNNFQTSNFGNEYKTTEAEVRISNVSPGMIDYTVGANYFREDIDELYHGWNAPVATWYDQGTWRNRINPVNNTTRDAWGVFVQGTWHVTEQLGLIAGVRYTHDEMEREGTFAAGPNFLQADGTPCRYPNTCIGAENNGGSEDHKTTWRVGLNYQVTPDNLLYTAVATGFKGGGFNDIDPTLGPAAGTQPYDPEELISYELGYKGRPAAGLIYSSQLYYYDFQKQQINGTFQYFPPPGNTGSININYTTLAHSRIYGWENELSYRLTSQTSLDGSASFARSEYVDFLAGRTIGQQVQWAGRELDKIPSFDGTLGISHVFTLSNDNELKLRFRTRYNSGYYLSDTTNAVQYTQDGFTRSNASLAYLPAGQAYSLELFVENIENKAQKTNQPGNYNGTSGTLTGGVPTGATPYGVIFGTSSPRYYGVRLKVTF